MIRHAASDQSGAARDELRHTNTAADHERRARHYEATADSIENECWKALRQEMTIDPHKELCWKQDDIRFLEANRNAAGQGACGRRRAAYQRVSQPLTAGP